MARDALELGVDFVMQKVTKINYKKDQSVSGVKLENGETITSNKIVLASGAWSTQLLPDLERLMRPTAQVVFHFEIPSHLKHLFESPKFATFFCDSENGLYGFPSHPFDGRFKIGDHSFGDTMVPTKINALAYGNKVRQEKEKFFREFLKENLPSIVIFIFIYLFIFIFNFSKRLMQKLLGIVFASITLLLMKIFLFAIIQNTKD